MTEIDAKTGALVKVLPASSYEFGYPFGVSSDGTHVWITNNASYTVTEIGATSAGGDQP